MKLMYFSLNAYRFIGIYIHLYGILIYSLFLFKMCIRFMLEGGLYKFKCNFKALYYNSLLLFTHNLRNLCLIVQTMKLNTKKSIFQPTFHQPIKGVCVCLCVF